MKMQYDKYKQIEQTHAYLAKPNGKRICSINSIDVDSADFNGKTNDLSSISFNVEKYIQTNDCEMIESNGYHLFSKYMKLFVSNIGWFIMETPEIHNTGIKEYKSIRADSAQVEYNQIPLDMWKVNCGTTDSLEMLIEGNVEIIEGVEFAKENIKFYEPEKPEFSLVDILVSKVPGWKVGYVDNIPKTYETIENGEVVQTHVLLKDEGFKFDIDYMSCYSFMTQDFEKFFNIIVDFDYLNMVVNFYRVENYGKNTNVTIGFRNIENSNDITIDEENIFTKYRVSGGDGLGIEQVNGGDNYLIYLDEYWLNEKYLSSSTIAKYKAWYDFCQQSRKEYTLLSKQWVEQQEIITELYDRLPLDGCSQDWKSYNDDDLIVEKQKYEAQKQGYESIYLDDYGNFDINLLNASDDADTYHQIVDVILPNIEIEISNRKLESSVDMDEYIKSYETDWKLYGIYELEARLKSYRDIIGVFQKDHYDITYDEYMKLSATDSEKYPPHTVEGHNNQYNEYLKSSIHIDENNIDSCAYALSQRKSEAKIEEDKQAEIQEARLLLGKQMALESWKDDTLDSFTNSELTDLSHIINPTTYTNENIFVTSIDSAVDKIITQEKLCENALEDLKVYSVPQTICTLSLDNILSSSGNEIHVHDLDYGNFIRVGLRDDYFVKLRVIGMSFNPFLYNNEFKFEFSNMIRSSSKRNDFVSLLNLGSNLTNSSVSTSYESNNQIDDDNIYSILQKLLNRYGITLNGYIGNGQNVTASGLETEMIKCVDINVENGFFQYLQSQLISAGQIVADDASFKRLYALVAAIDNLLAGNVSAELAHIINLTAENVNISEAVIKDLIATQITVSMLQAGDISSDRFHITSDDGKFEIVGNTMQFKDNNDVVRIQIGNDANGNFTFCLYDETGKGVLIDSTGIKDSAISDGLIKTDMIANGAVTEDKIDKTNIREWTDENGNKIWDVATLYYGDDKFEVSYNQVKQEITNHSNQIEDLSAMITSIELSGAQVFVENNGTLTPSSITITAKCKNGAVVDKWFIDNVENTSYVSSDEMSISIPSSYMTNKKSIIVKAQDTTRNLYDEYSVYKVIDGKDGQDGQDGVVGILSSSVGQVFKEGETDTYTTMSMTVYKGSSVVIPSSYKWFKKSDNDSNWTQIATTPTVTIQSDSFIATNKIKCEFDL